MKKLILFSLSGLLLMVLFNKPKATAQGFHIVASFGTTHAWNVPAAIEYEIYDYYPYHNWVHVNRVVRGRRIFYNILLERDGFYTELQFGRYSRLLRTQFYADYPLYNHFCSAHCGYHNAYFNSHRVVNNHYYYGGHNHFVYRPQPRHYTTPVRPQSVRYTDYGNRNRNNRVVANDTRVVRSNSSSNRSESARVTSNTSASNTRTVAPARSNANSRSSGTVSNNRAGNTRSNDAVRSNSTTVTRPASSTTNNTRVTPVAQSTRTVNSAPANTNSRSVSSRSTSENSRSSSTSVATNRKAAAPAVSNSSRAATTTSRTSSSNGRSSSRGN